MSFWHLALAHPANKKIAHTSYGNTTSEEAGHRRKQKAATNGSRCSM